MLKPIEQKGILRHEWFGEITVEFPSEPFNLLHKLFITRETSHPGIFSDIGYTGKVVVVNESPREIGPGGGMYIIYEVRSIGD